MKTLALEVLENLKEQFGDLSNLAYSNWELRRSVSDFLKSNGEGFRLEGNSFGAYLEDENEDIYFISFTKDAPYYILLKKHEEYPIHYDGTDIININRVVYKSEDGYYANWNQNEDFYFDFDNYPEDIVYGWNNHNWRNDGY